MSFASFSSLTFQRHRSRRRCSALASSNKRELRILRLGVGLGDARPLILEETADRFCFGVAYGGKLPDRLGLARLGTPLEFGFEIRSVVSGPGPDAIDDLLGGQARGAERVVKLLERRRLAHRPEGLDVRLPMSRTPSRRR